MASTTTTTTANEPSQTAEEEQEDSHRIRRVLDFWFGKPNEPGYLQPKSFWYGNKADDDLVRDVLSQDYADAQSGLLDHWASEADGAIALVILLDQVPRNIFRDTPEAFATDSKALEVAKRIVANGWDRERPSIVRRYIYSPFNHSENLADQERSLQLFTQLGDSQHLYWAKNFYTTIKTYGRFPHRDRILGRK